MTIFYHGNQSKFDKFKQGQPWTAFDGKSIQRPVWLSPSKDFAKLYAGHHGYVYTVEYTPKKLFPDKEVTEWVGRYVELTPFGQSLMEDLIADGVFGPSSDPDLEEAEAVVKEVDKRSYGTMETSFMVNWLKKNGYTAFEVAGDGPINIAVMDIENITIVECEHVDTFKEQVKRIIKKYIREQLERTQVQRAGGARQPPAKQSGADLEQMLAGLQASFAEMDKRKLEQSKRDPSFRNNLKQVEKLVDELQKMLAPLQ